MNNEQYEERDYNFVGPYEPGQVSKRVDQKDLERMRLIEEQHTRLRIHHPHKPTCSRSKNILVVEKKSLCPECGMTARFSESHSGGLPAEVERRIINSHPHKKDCSHGQNILRLVSIDNGMFTGERYSLTTCPECGEMQEKRTKDYEEGNASCLHFYRG